MKMNKKDFGGLVIVILFVVAIIGSVVLYLTSNRWQLAKKNWKTNHTEGLEREVVVTNAITGDVMWTYEGRCYILGDSTVGNITVMIYDSEGKIKKVDFIGSMINFQMVEK